MDPDVYTILAVYALLILFAVYRQVEGCWRWRLVRRAARRLAPGPGTTTPPTSLRLPAEHLEVLPTFRGVPVPACGECGTRAGWGCQSWCSRRFHRC